jgi:hypothetical protein
MNGRPYVTSIYLSLVHSHALCGARRHDEALAHGLPRPWAISTIDREIANDTPISFIVSQYHVPFVKGKNACISIRVIISLSENSGFIPAFPFLANLFHIRLSIIIMKWMAVD